MKINHENIKKIFQSVEKEGRNFLLEHEVYQILKEVHIRTPQWLFVKKGQKVEEKALSIFEKKPLVLKIVAPMIVHKTDVGGVQFVENDVKALNKVCENMFLSVPKKFQNWMKKFNRQGKKNHPSLEEIDKEIRGTLICERVDYDRTGFGTELLVGIKNSREFGPTVTMGIGGVEIEYLSERIKEGKAISISSAYLLEKKGVLRLLEPLAVYDKLVGKVRGKEALISEDELIETYLHFHQLGAYYSPYEIDHPYVIEELEVNPFVVQEKKLIALDGMCRFSKNH